MMLRIAVTCLLVAVASATSGVCSHDQYKRYGEACSCTDYCLDNSHCQSDSNGGYSCQCLPFLEYDPVKKQCIFECCPVSTTPGSITSIPASDPTTPEPETTTRQVTCEDKVIADIYFLGDSSNSINSIGWGRELRFIVNIVNAFPLGPNNVQAAFGIFSTNFEHQFDLDAYADKSALEGVVISTAQLKSNTFTYDALNAINKNGYLTSAEHGGGRNVPKILIVITDGQSQNVTRTIAEADDLRKQNITILAVGVGITNPTELLGIGGDPSNVFSVKTFSGLESIRKQITQHVCDGTTPPIVIPCPKIKQLDLVFVIDSSIADSLSYNLVFVTSVIRAFIPGENAARFALLISDTRPEVIFDLTSTMDIVYQSLSNVTYTTDHINSYGGLLAASHLFSSRTREGVIKTIVLLSDGKSLDSSQTIQEAEEVKNSGINIITLGILPAADVDELAVVASKPEYSFTVKDYNDLYSFAKNVVDANCDEQVPPTPVDACREKPCQHICTNVGDGFSCSCQPGFHVSSSDPTKCDDDNECSKKPCNQTCTNTEGSFTCSCGPGFAVSPSDPTKCQEPTCVDELAADIYFLGDSSNSIANIGWGRELKFIVNITQVFKLGPNDVQVGFGIFSTNFKHIFNLNAYTDQGAFAHAVLSTTQLKSNTYTHLALNAVNQNAYLSSASIGGGRNVPKILIVITDGQSLNITLTIEAANNLRRNNITILSIGVGFINPVELQEIAGSSKNVFSVNSFGVLDTIRGEITQRICDVPELPEVTPCPRAGQLDLIMVIDTLSKVGSTNFNRLYVLLGSIIRAFTIGQDSVKIGLFFSDIDTTAVFELTSTLDVIYQALAASSTLKNTTTHTFNGFVVASQFFTPEHGGRVGATKTIVLISDGKNHDGYQLIQEAEEVKDREINVVTLAVLPEADVDQLSALASKPESSIKAQNYGSLLKSANDVAQAICKAS